MFLLLWDSFYQRTMDCYYCFAMYKSGFTTAPPFPWKTEEDWENWNYWHLIVYKIFPSPNCCDVILDPNLCSNLLSLACGLSHWIPHQSDSYFWNSKVNERYHTLNNGPELNTKGFNTALASENNKPNFRYMTGAQLEPGCLLIFQAIQSF